MLNIFLFPSLFLFPCKIHEEVTTGLHLVTLSLNLIHPVHESMYGCVRTHEV
jgi:hypothetical protein